LRGEESAEGFKKRAFPGAIGTDYADEFATFNPERDILEDPIPAITKRNGT
jgi:hypothetical protein